MACRARLRSADRSKKPVDNRDEGVAVVPGLSYEVAEEREGPMNKAKTGAMASGTKASGRALAVACALTLGCVLAGCTRPGPVGAQTTSGPPSASNQSRWTDDEQSAIDAVRRYLDLWTEISQNIGTADWNRIYEVAGDPVAETDISYWTEWSALGQYLVGSPDITVSSVKQGFLDSQGMRHHVYTCWDATNAYLFNLDGSRVEDRGLDRQLNAYTVVNLGPDTYRVIGQWMENETC